MTIKRFNFSMINDQKKFEHMFELCFLKCSWPLLSLEIFQKCFVNVLVPEEKIIKYFKHAFQIWLIMIVIEILEHLKLLLNSDYALFFSNEIGHKVAVGWYNFVSSCIDVFLCKSFIFWILSFNFPYTIPFLKCDFRLHWNPLKILYNF